jgi:hypothetical protein
VTLGGCADYTSAFPCELLADSNLVDGDHDGGVPEGRRRGAMPKEVE